jgi:hypothetical protein
LVLDEADDLVLAALETSRNAVLLLGAGALHALELVHLVVDCARVGVERGVNEVEQSHRQHVKCAPQVAT